MKAYGKYDVMKKVKDHVMLYKTCPNRAYAYTVATDENNKQYTKGIYITDPRFVQYYICPTKKNN